MAYPTARYSMYYQNGSASCFKARLSERETLNLRVFTPSFNPSAILLSVHIGYGFGLAPVYLASPYMVEF